MTDQTPSPQSVVVPVEPTEEMILAGCIAGQDGVGCTPWFHASLDQDDGVHRQSVREYVTRAVSAALAAAPAPSRGDYPIAGLGAVSWNDLRAILAALSPEAPAREGVAKALYLKLIDTLKPFAEVAEKLKHCHVVEICEPTPDNPSRNIIPMPREWFERAADDLEVIAIQLHSDGVLSEGQTAKLTGLDRVEVRKQADALTRRHEAPASHAFEASHSIQREGGCRVCGHDEASHEAPADDEMFGVTGACGEVEALACALFANRCPGIVMHDDDMDHYRDAASRAFAVLDGLEAPAEGAGEAARIIACHLPISEAPDTVCLPITMTAGDLRAIYAALRARSSAPEAREALRVVDEASDTTPAMFEAREGEAVAWRMRPNDGLTYDWAIVQSNPNKTAKVRADLYEVQPLYTHPAAPSADKLRIASAALEPFAKEGDGYADTVGDDYLIEGDVTDLTLGDLRRASKALAALKAECA